MKLFIAGFDSVDTKNRPVVYFSGTAGTFIQAFKRSKERIGGRVYALSEVSAFITEKPKK